MSNARSQDNFIAYVAAAIVITLVCVSLFAWNNARNADQFKPDFGYIPLGPLRVETQQFSLKANLAVQTSKADTAWAKDNRNVLNVIFRKILTDADANTIKAPNSLQLLQDALKNGSNAALNTDKVQAVLLTDFVFEPNDSQGH